MRYFIKFIAFGFIVIVALAADTTITNETDAAQREQLFQRFLKEMREWQSKDPTNFHTCFPTGFTNLDTPDVRDMFFRMLVVDPSFGTRWDEVPPPTMTDSNAMQAVDAFVATNGWNMQTDGWIFTSAAAPDKSKSIRGLPWKAIHDRKFPAVTCNGILYVFFKGFNFDSDGVAYNPQTNAFARRINGFKPIGRHWYVWAMADPEPEVPLAKEYEGQKQ